MCGDGKFDVALGSSIGLGEGLLKCVLHFFSAEPILGKSYCTYFLFRGEMAGFFLFRSQPMF